MFKLTQVHKVSVFWLLNKKKAKVVWALCRNLNKKNTHLTLRYTANNIRFFKLGIITFWHINQNSGYSNI